jgi:AcrR family transcriptional regulator
LAEGVGRKQIKELRPLQILDAAFAEFTDKGYAAARLEDVARRVGVTKGTIYIYFPTKADLFVAVARAHLQPILDRQIEIDPATLGDVSASELLRRYTALAYADVTGEPRSREFFRLMIAEGSRVPEIVEFYVTEVMKYGVDQLRGLLDYGVRRGEFRKEAVEKLYAHPDMIFGPGVLACIMQMLMGDRHGIDFERWIDAHLDLVLNGLRVR